MSGHGTAFSLHHGVGVTGEVMAFGKARFSEPAVGYEGYRFSS